MTLKMKTTINRFRKFAFENRIFVSFSIVLIVCFLAFTKFKNHLMVGVVLFKLLGVTSALSQTLSFALAALIMIVASLWRMWAGSILTPRTMMRFAVQNDRLITIGPYRIVRNPIYLADLMAFVGFSLILPAIGLLMPVLLLIHYEQIIRHEEKALLARHGAQFKKYCQQVNRLLPDFNSIKRLPFASKEFILTSGGITHNALYLFFVPGFLLSAFTHQVWQAIAIGLPGVVIWTGLHLRLGVEKNRCQTEKILTTKK